MDNVKKNLNRELLADPNVRLLHSATWTIPIQEIEISYETVKRTPMDLLMKMLLIVFSKMQTDSVEEISDLLRVEPLFIEDMIKSMQYAKMIEKKPEYFSLTDTGKEQLKLGIFIHPPEKEEKTAYYSSTHGEFLFGELKEGSEPLYRYAKEEVAVEKIEENQLRKAVDKLSATIEEELLITVQSIRSVTELDMHTVPIFEYHLYHAAEDKMYARVWNSLSAQWDEQLAEEIMEKELSTWREHYKI